MRRTSAALGILLCSLPVSMALADDQVTEALHNNFFQESHFESCSSNFCTATLPATSHTTTVVTAVSCFITVQSNGRVLQTYLSTSKSGGAEYNVQFFYQGASGDGSLYYGVNAQVNMFYGVRENPVFNVETVGGPAERLICTVSGYHS